MPRGSASAIQDSAKVRVKGNHRTDQILHFLTTLFPSEPFPRMTFVVDVWQVTHSLIKTGCVNAFTNKDWVCLIASDLCSQTAAWIVTVLYSSFLSESVYGGGQPGCGECLSLSLELTDLVRLANQQDPRIFLSPPTPPPWFLCENLNPDFYACMANP